MALSKTLPSFNRRVFQSSNPVIEEKLCERGAACATVNTAHSDSRLNGFHQNLESKMSTGIFPPASSTLHSFLHAIRLVEISRSSNQNKLQTEGAKASRWMRISPFKRLKLVKISLCKSKPRGPKTGAQGRDSTQKLKEKTSPRILKAFVRRNKSCRDSAQVK